VAVTPKMGSCRVLKTMGRFVSPLRAPCRTVIINDRIEWDQENLKTDFSKIIFTKEAFRATREIPNEQGAKMKNRDEEEFNFSINHQRQLG